MTITSKGKRWERLHSLWLGWVVLTFGLLSWVALVYIGIRARQRKWVLWGLIYAVPIALAWSSDAGDNSSVLLYSFLAAWVISSVHAFRLRKEYLMRLEALQRGAGVSPAAMGRRHEMEYGNHTKTTSSRQSSTQQADTTSRPDTLGQPVSSSRTSRSPLPADASASTIDLNNASEQELAKLPGLGTAVAKRAVSLRESQGAFRSFEDFGQALNLESHAIEKIRALAFVSVPRQTIHPDAGSTQTLMTHDVSEISVLRKRLGRAAFSMKVIGLLSAIYFLVYFPSAGAWTFIVGLALSILVYWCAVRLSKRLRAGDTFAAKLILVWWFLWVAVNLFDAGPKALGDEYNNFDIFSALGMAIFTLPIYFVARGLYALRAYKRRPEIGSREAEPLLSHPWESGGQKMERHPAFVNKRSLSLYFLLLLVPLPYVFIQLNGLMQDTTVVTQGTTQADLMGEQVGYSVGALAIWLSLTVFLYRRARRRALLPATELSKRNPRPIILYLRSFLDDKIKMRARAANGRSNLERVVKITFEEVITDHLWRYGPVVAIGKPGDKLPPLGAARDYVLEGSWQQKVEQMMAQASIIVVVVGRTEGLAWELNKIIELGLIRKLVLLLPPVQVGNFVGDLPTRWDALCEHASEVGLMLPRDIDFHRTRAMVFPTDQLAHAITTDGQNDWAYETVLDAAAELIHPPGHRSESTAATASEQQDFGAEHSSTQSLTQKEGEASSSN